MERFLIEKFQNPDNQFYPVYDWTWNEVLDAETIKRQIDEFYENNIRGFYVIPMPGEFRPNSMVTNMQPPYLSDGYFEMLCLAVDYAHSKGMECWFYDEAGWPSGNANFLVTADDDNLNLVVARGGKPVVLNNFADLSNRNATDKFIKLTHQQHKEKMGASFKKLAPYVFTDEPNIGSTPYTESIRKRFYEIAGYELDPEKICSRKNPEFNILYHDVCSQVFTENYFIPVRDWCRDNGMLSTGHLDCEDETLGHLNGLHYAMRCLRAMDVPGVDTIWGQIDIGKECLFFPRLASSAAEQIGTGLSLTESMSVYGVSPFERFRYIIGYQIVRGINVLNPLLLLYDNSGYYTLRQRPSYNYPQPGLENLAAFNKYLASLQYLMQVGTPDICCALYMPLRSFWAHDEDTQKAVDSYESMGAAIERNHSQFDLVDDDLLLNCDTDALKQGRIQMGRASYSVLYIPADKYMPQAVKERLQVFASNGGQIYRPDDAEFIPVLNISGDDGKLRVHKRISENTVIYVVFNEAAYSVTAKMDFPDGTYELNAFDGMRYALSDTYEIESGEIKLFITDTSADVLASLPTCGEQVAEITEFVMKPFKQFTLSEDGAEYREIPGEAVAVACGDWSNVLGADFSGDCEYKATFTLMDTKQDLILSIDDVKYYCHAYVNGQNVGSAMMPPYRFTIDKNLLKTENELVLKVSNTAANAFVYFKIPDSWEQKHIGPYHQRAFNQEKEFVHGGLRGPVKLFTKQ